MVKWLDAVADSGWTDDAEFKPHECYTVGFILHEDNLSITLGGTISGLEHNTSMTIPKSWVLSQKEVTL